MTKFNAAFWKWFGDSKVVDGRGRPLVVYHGTRVDFSQFKLNSKPNQAVLLSEGFFFSTSKTASSYASSAEGEGGNVMPVYLSLQDPLIVDDPESGISRYAANYYDLTGKDLQKQARASGHDGIIVRAHRKKDRTTYVAFYPEQVKSAIGNDGSWDADDPDIRSNPPSNAVIAYHGTSLSIGEKIAKEGYVRPREDGGNWDGGLFGGNPSCPNLVYLANDKSVAENYAREIAIKRKEKDGAIITVSVDQKTLVPDEDLIFELFESGHGELAQKVRRAFADIHEFDDVDSAVEYWDSLIEEGISDSEVADQMCDLADYVAKKFKAKDLAKLTTKASVMAVVGAVPVIGMEVIAR